MIFTYQRQSSEITNAANIGPLLTLVRSPRLLIPGYLTINDCGSLHLFYRPVPVLPLESADVIWRLSTTQCDDDVSEMSRYLLCKISMRAAPITAPWPADNIIRVLSET